MPGVRSNDARGAVNREIEPPIELGLPYWFHLFFPDRLLSTDLNLLVIGCEHDLALRLARANPRARVTAVDERPAALESAARAREQRNLGNLELVAGWPARPGPEEGFDLVYYNPQGWPGDPSAVLEQAADLLRPDGSLHLTVRAKYAWTGVRTVRELLDRLGIEPNADGYPRARQLVAALTPEHPWNLLGPDPNLRPDDLLADWLGPDEPCFSVPEVYALLAGSGMALQRFTYQAYYLPQCSALARTPLLAEVRQLPTAQQQALMELYWPGVRYHLAVACRADRPAHTFATDFSGRGWLRYAPLLPARLPLEDDESPVGAKARLRWRAPGMPEVGLSLGGFQYRLLRALDRAEELGDVVGVSGLSGDPQLRDEWARDFFQLMADFDFLHFRTCPASEGAPTRPEGRAADAAPAALGLPAVAEPLALASDLERLTPQPAIECPPQSLEARTAEAAQQPPQLEVEPQPAVEPHLVEGPPNIEPLPAVEPPPEVEPVAAASSLHPSQSELDSQLPALELSWELAELSGELAQQGGEAGERADAAAAEFERIPYETCPLCAEPGYQPFRHAEAEFLAGAQFIRVPIPWMRCRRCAHVFTEGYFTGEVWQRILDVSQRERGSLRQAVANRAQASRIVSAVTTLREKAGGRWLDVDSSYGGLISVAAEFGYDCVGLDCCAPGAERLRELGYPVRAGSLFDCADGPFDVISLSGTLDRTPFPAQALSHLRRLLAPRGLLFLSAPSSDSLSWRNLDFEGLNPYWARLDRYHTFHRKTVFRLLENTGFEPCGYAAGAPEPVGMEVIACRR
jgi:SAM-dependent methyltransferase